MIETNQQPPLKQISFKRRYLMITWGIFLMVAGFYYFIIPANLVIGGVSGVGLLLGELLDVSISFVVLILNIILLFVGWAFLGFKSFYRSIYGSLLFPFILFLFEQLSPTFEFLDDFVLVVAFGGLFLGLGFGYVIKYGGTSGGTDIPIKILNKRLKLPLSISMYSIDGIIIASGVLAFYQTSGVTPGLYAIMTMVVGGKVADWVVLGSNTTKAVHIITDEADKIKDAIYERVYRGVSLVPMKGGYSNIKKQMLITIITKDEYYTVRSIVAEVDPQAFVYASPASEIHGDFSYRTEDD